MVRHQFIGAKSIATPSALKDAAKIFEKIKSILKRILGDNPEVNHRMDTIDEIIDNIAEVVVDAAGTVQDAVKGFIDYLSKLSKSFHDIATSVIKNLG